MTTEPQTGAVDPQRPTLIQDPTIPDAQTYEPSSSCLDTQCSGHPQTDKHIGQQQKGNTVLKQDIIEPIEQRMDSRPGPRSQLSIKALLAGIIIAATRRRPYSPAAVAEALSSVSAEEAAELGLTPADLPKQPVSYEIVRRRMKRLEDALAAGWTVNGSQYDLNWLTTDLLAASVPAAAARRCETIAIDRTAFSAWSVRRHGKENAPSGDGRVVRSLDPDARTGFRWAADQGGGCLFEGYDILIAAVVDSDPYVLGLQVEPAGADLAKPGLEAIKMARRIAPGFSEVHADRGFARLQSGIPTVSENYQRSYVSFSIPNDALPDQLHHLGAKAAPRTPGVRTEVVMAWLNAGRYFEAGDCRRPGVAVHTMAALAAVVALNLYFRRNQAGRVRLRPGSAATSSGSLTHHWCPAHLRPSPTEPEHRRLTERHYGFAHRGAPERTNRDIKSRTSSHNKGEK